MKGIDKIQNKIQKTRIIKKNCFLFLLNKLILKNGTKVIGERDSFDTIMCLGPIKFRVLANIVGKIYKFSNLFR